MVISGVSVLYAVFSNLLLVCDNEQSMAQVLKLSLSTALIYISGIISDKCSLCCYLPVAFRTGISTQDCVLYA